MCQVPLTASLYTPGHLNQRSQLNHYGSRASSPSPSQSVAPSVSQRVRQSASEAESRHNDAGHIFPRQGHEYPGFGECSGRRKTRGALFSASAFVCRRPSVCLSCVCLPFSLSLVLLSSCLPVCLSVSSRRHLHIFSCSRFSFFT